MNLVFLKSVGRWCFLGSHSGWLPGLAGSPKGVDFVEQGEAGLSLVEVLVAMTIFAVGMMGVLQMFLVATIQVRIQEDKELAYQVLVSEAEEIDGTAFEELVPGNFKTRIVSTGGQVFFVSFDVDQGDDDTTWESGEELDYYLRRVTVVVEWRSLKQFVGRVESVKLRMRTT